MFINHEYIYKILEETKNPSNEQIKEVLNRAKNREGGQGAVHGVVAVRELDGADAAVLDHQIGRAHV